ncbi:hypothetical protein Lal_00032741 [Lupinus albus]|uniref:Uncharacterized protein n=1 Tax=Lupinus albus TaxID=3870 RepID=A0A6A5PLL5_LUPAL|nr:hypothetical protein Lalb_Chr01g0020551 [Lupinus albus]KAF1897979.1 hypothetical protein Lal_00032741 [Lupinus albus]
MSLHIPSFITTIIIFFLFFFFSIAIASFSSNFTFYDHLRQQGLPAGLVPKGITKYSVNSGSGEFLILMEEPCNAKFENELHYETNITGTLKYGSIAGLSGVLAQELFLWFPVKEIRVDLNSSGLIHFDVGVADKQFSLSLFEDPPHCKSENRLQNRVHADGEDVLRAAS